MYFFFSSRRRHTRSLRDWSSDVCSSDLDRVARQAERVLVAANAEPERLARLEADAPQALLEAELQQRRLHVVVRAHRSEERRVGKECRFRWSAYHLKKKSAQVVMTM